MVLVAVQRNMMRWGRKHKVYPGLSSFACVPVIKASIPTVAPRSPMLNSPCTLSLYCHAEQHAWLWLPLCECPTDAKQHISGATKEHVAGLGLRIRFKHWISWNELCVFTFAYYCFYGCGLHIWHSTLLLRICIFIHHFFCPPQNFRFSALDCTVTLFQQPLTAHHQHPLLVWCGRAGQGTIFRTNRWPLI